MARVLLVEDDSQVGELVRRFLEREGFAVAWVRFGREALERVGEEGADVVVLDRGLPDMEGLEVLKGLRSLDPLLPVLLLTGRADEESRVEGLLEGADDYLGKPFSLRSSSPASRPSCAGRGRRGGGASGPWRWTWGGGGPTWKGSPSGFPPRR